jgi:hypothetical protein
MEELLCHLNCVSQRREWLVIGEPVLILTSRPSLAALAAVVALLFRTSLTVR